LPVVTQSLGIFASSLAKHPFVGSAPPVYFVSAFMMQVERAAASGLPLFLPSQPSSALARLVTHFSWPLVHLLRVLGGAPGSSARRTAPAIPVLEVKMESESVWVRHGWLAPLASSLAKHPLVRSSPPVYLSLAFLMQAGNLTGSGFALSLL